MGCAGGELFYSRLDKLGLKLDVRVSFAEFIMTKINKFSFEGPSNHNGCRIFRQSMLWDFYIRRYKY